MKELGRRHKLHELRFFIDVSKHNLKRFPYSIIIRAYLFQSHVV